MTKSFVLLCKINTWDITISMQRRTSDTQRWYCFYKRCFFQYTFCSYSLQKKLKRNSDAMCCQTCSAAALNSLSFFIIVSILNLLIQMNAFYWRYFGYTNIQYQKPPPKILIIQLSFLSVHKCLKVPIPLQICRECSSRTCGQTDSQSVDGRWDWGVGTGGLGDTDWASRNHSHRPEIPS